MPLAAVDRKPVFRAAVSAGRGRRRHRRRPARAPKPSFTCRAWPSSAAAWPAWPAAWLLDGVCDVRLFEARNSLGGNVRTVRSRWAGRREPSTSAHSFSTPAPTPPMRSCSSNWACGRWPLAKPVLRCVDHAGRAQREPAALRLAGAAGARLAAAGRMEPPGGAGVQDHLRRRAPREQANASWLLPMADWLATLPITPAQADTLILPWAAALNSDDVTQTRGLSARALMVFAAGALPASPLDPIVYHVLERGMIEPLNRMVAQFTTAQSRSAWRWTRWRRPPEAATWCSRTRGRHSRSTPWYSPRPARQRWRCCKACPARPWRATRCRASVSIPHVSHCMQTLRSRQRSAVLVVLPQLPRQGHALRGVHVAGPGARRRRRPVEELDQHRAPPQQVLASADFLHVVPSPSGIVAQRVLANQQGRGGLWFAGGYTLPFDSQETALLSAITVAEGLAGGSARTQRLRRRLAPDFSA